jgi:hypothetical protein
MNAENPTYRTMNEKISATVWWFSIPALTVLVFTRRWLGFRQITLARQTWAVLVLSVLAAQLDNGNLLIPFIATVRSDHSLSLIMVFMAAFLLAGYWHKRSYKKRVMEGDLWHSYSMGIPWLEYMFPLPSDWIRRFIEPTLVMFIGMIIMVNLSGILGWWLFMAGIGINLWEGWITEQIFNQFLNSIDNLCDAEATKAENEYLKQAQEQGKQAAIPMEQTAGIPTGIAPDIAEQLQKRRARKPVTEDLA